MFCNCYYCLQSTHVGYGVVNEENVYICTGNPLQSDIQSIVDWMLNDSFTDAYKSIFSVLTLQIRVLSRSSGLPFNGIFLIAGLI